MYRRLLINIYHVRNGFIRRQNPRLPPYKKCEVLSVSSWSTGKANQRLLRTSSITSAENKDSTTSLSEETESKEGNAQINNNNEQRNAENNEVTEMSKDELMLKAETGDVAKPKDSKDFQKTKSGKEGLLELLGAMKVEVTTKRKVRPPKIPKAHERPEVKAMESAHSMFQHAAAEAEPQRETLNPELVAAATAAAATLPNSHQAESELLKQLRKHESGPNAQRRPEGQNIGDIIADMKVGKRQSARTSSRPSSQIRFDDDGQGYIHDRSITSELDGIRRRKSPFSSKRLNIFTAAVEQVSVLDVGPTLWDIELANQIAQSVNQLPRNGFEEMIKWTREGKLWQYPINNEAGLEEEAHVPFHEHVFLEKYLEFFPRQGPVRHFMELVITGLSKNHHLTVKQKQEHIAWFRDYFQQKENILQEAEA